MVITYIIIVYYFLKIIDTQTGMKFDGRIEIHIMHIVIVNKFH